jgi:site-specific DNA-cytosine methylase
LGLGRTAENADSFKGRPGLYGVNDWLEPAPAVTGSASVTGSNGVAAVADPRLGCEPRSGTYGVLGWEEAAGTITGVAGVDNGRFAVADPRLPPRVTPVIVAADGTWHRPMSTLDLAALQGLPAELDGEPLTLAGPSVARWRERIGNAVPVQAATAIATSLLVALLAGKLGTWFLSNEGVWVRDDGRSEHEWGGEAYA